MLVLLNQEEQDAGRDQKIPTSPCSVCSGEVVSRSHTKTHSNASKFPAKTKHQVFRNRVRKAHPSGMQNKSLQNILLVILRNIISMCEMGDKEINTDFSGLV